MSIQRIRQSKIAKNIAVGGGLFLVLLMVTLGGCAYRNTIRLGKVTWKRNWKQNNETTIYFSGNRLLTEKGIQLFGSGEYLIGTYITKEGNVITFSYSVEDRQLRYYRNLWEMNSQVKSAVDMHKFATFEDVKGQHADESKKELLEQWALNVIKK